MDICFQVVMQLEACGIVETIHISAAGFPIRSNLFFFKSSLKHCCCFFFLILTCLLVDLAFLFYRIAFKAFIQRYGLIAKQSTSESRTHCAGKCCLVLRANLDKSDLFFFGLMVSSFLSIAHFINSTHNSLLLLGHLHLVYKNKTF